MRRFIVVVLAIALILLVSMDIGVIRMAQHMLDPKKMQSVSYFHYLFFKYMAEIAYSKILLSSTNLLFCLLQIYRPIKPEFLKYLTIISGVVHIAFLLICCSGILMLLMYGTGSSISFGNALSAIFKSANAVGLIKGSIFIIIFSMLLFILPVAHQNLIARERAVNKS